MKIKSTTKAAVYIWTNNDQYYTVKNNSDVVLNEKGGFLTFTPAKGFNRVRNKSFLGTKYTWESKERISKLVVLPLHRIHCVTVA